jgi:hypothetical protein
VVTTCHLVQRYASPIFDPSLSSRILNFNQKRPLAVK